MKRNNFHRLAAAITTFSCTTFNCISTNVQAHPGHGVEDTGALHYFLSPSHLPATLFCLGTVGIALCLRRFAKKANLAA